jgi:hypothetical protein
MDSFTENKICQLIHALQIGCISKTQKCLHELKMILDELKLQYNKKTKEIILSLTYFLFFFRYQNQTLEDTILIQMYLEEQGWNKEINLPFFKTLIDFVNQHDIKSEIQELSPHDTNYAYIYKLLIQ